MTPLHARIYKQNTGFQGQDVVSIETNDGLSIFVYLYICIYKRKDKFEWKGRPTVLHFYILECPDA